MSHPGLLDLLARSGSLRRAEEAISAGKTPLQVVGAGGFSYLASAASLCNALNRPAFLVVPTPEEAVTAKRDLSDLIGADRVWLFPAREVMPFEHGGNQESLWMRVSTLAALATSGGPPPVVVLPATALLRFLTPPDQFKTSCRLYSKGMQVSPIELARQLVGDGYQREFSAEVRGQIALRGGILDVFPPGAEGPFRFEFAFEQIESIRTFDPETQVSMGNVDRVFVAPANDVREGQETAGATLLDYAPGALLLVSEMGRCHDVLAEFERIGAEIASARMVAGTMGKDEASVYLPVGHVIHALSRCHAMFSLITRPIQGVTIRDVVEADSSQQVGFAGRWNDLGGEFKDLLSRHKRLVVLAGTADRRALLQKWMERQEIWSVTVDAITEEPRASLVTLSLGSGENGFNVESLDLCVFTEAEIYGRTQVRQRKARKAKASIDWRELSAGDYVVHATHGIGQFMGLKTMTVAGVTRDYLYLRYAGTDALYVPIDQVDAIERYIGTEGKAPSLQKLGTGDWQRLKARVRASVEDMARKLLILEAKRKSRKGYAFSTDTPWQAEFEEAFEYEDTPDQSRATQEIKADMELPTPMDRLLCGDVGYGKTEVAMRAAFKAVMDGKQVGVLVPTTILAEQHFSTFTRRFADYPVSVRCLSRFRSGAEQKKIVDEVSSGAVDIVVGTHRLLSKDVRFKNLGILIIDEEHRFGVAQKERLKEISENCDVLTLTATPIPRTLNMAMSGLRDISVIETPPVGRFPVETYVVPANPSLISQAVRREMRRGGQVFYVYNRVYSIGRVFNKVQSLVPEARIAVAHGKMPEHQLSLTMQNFLQGRYDVLISTTIIESGLDLPNVNTLIVEDADKLGLAQLYQLRGRVGRSNRIAYAYFTYRHDRSMTYIAEQRLSALRDFTSMGSGYRLAMRDMEIRGAGNLLGAEQHGFMHQVGYEMYVSLLEKAVRSLRGMKEEPVERILTGVEIPVDAYLPTVYVENPRDRFSFYKRIAAAADLETLSEIESELQDRYGQLPVEVENLLDVASMRLYAGKMGVTQISLARPDVVMGRERLNLKVEVPHLFALDKVASLDRKFPGAEFDRRSQCLSIPIEKPGAALDRGIALLRHLSRGE